MSGDDSRLDKAVIDYLEAVEGGRAPDRAAFPELAQFFADEDAVEHWTAPLREAARALAAGPADPRVTTSLPGHGRDVPQLASFGDYEVIEELGRGAMGVVCKARHTKLNRLVALKMILAGDYAGAEHKARFLAEAQAVARFQHPHIVQIHEIGDHDGRPYFSLEFVEGGNLAGRLKGSSLTDQEAAQLVEVLARAIDHAHQRGIIHRDLKPANVLLTPDGRPKVADFGLARFLGTDIGQTPDGVVVGTASYMAPEQAAGRGAAIGPFTDVYALGAILYECLTGRPPFRGTTLLQTLLLVQHEPLDRPRLHNPRVGRSLQAICLMCLAKNPQDRYPSAAALADDLGAYLRGEPVRADGGPASRLVQAMLRETRYTEVMTRWGAVWMGIAVLYFLICLAKSLLLWGNTTTDLHLEPWRTDHVPFFFVWAGGLLGSLGLAWAFRLRGGPPLSHVERQLAQIWAIFWAGFFLTAFQFWHIGGPIDGLLPILILEGAVAFGCMATILGGSFHLMAAACLATALLEANWPKVGPLISAVVCSPGLFWLGWTYWRRAPSA